MKAYLILENGTVFEGVSIGASGESIGEVVFTTAMVGYMETITDPSYYGQIVTQTFPLIGNYGAMKIDSESVKPELAGYIVRELCPEGSNFRKEEELDEFLKRNNIVGIAGIDTRALTRIIRESGVMNGMISKSKSSLAEKISKLEKYKVEKAVENTSSKSVQVINEGGKHRVVLWDFGAKANIERELIKRNCEVIRVPYSTSAEEILAYKPNGIMLSNGGGNPADNVGVVKELKKLLDRKVPTFGICLGHQLLALAMGGRTVKLKYGHRGANQPVKDLKTGKVFITSQNHGYAVDEKSLNRADAEIRFSNANDFTCEGVDYISVPAFSVQFHPEACGGPEDTEFLFDRFIRLMEDKKNA